MLADEITPDSCRLWDMKTGKKLDKDRFPSRFRRGEGKLFGSVEPIERKAPQG